MIPPHIRIFVCTEPIDFRKSFDGLTLAARERLGEDPRSGGLFAFTNRGSNRLKLLWFDKNGVCLLYKRMHRAVLRLPPNPDGKPAVSIDAHALARLLEGVPVPERAVRGRA
jgi:transposase